MKNYIGIMTMIILLLLTACAKENLGDCFKSTGKDVTEKRMLPEFNRMEIDDPINVWLVESNESSAEVTAGENLQEFIITEVRNGVLYIENDNRCNWVRSYKREINVMIKSPEINEITYYGSGDLRCLGSLSPSSFLLNAWEASGNIELELNCDDIELKLHTGPVDLSCKGAGESLVVYNNGLGNLDSRNFSAKDVLAVNANSGSLTVFSDSLLNANIEGNGDMFYLGNPQISLKKIGNGRLIKLD
jgi:hypothetical protein